jgi:DNA-binding MarR family transcriptional regulator
MTRKTERLQLDRYLPYRLSILSNTVSGAIARQYAEGYGLSVPDWRVMAVLGLAQPLTQKEVCARTRMDKVQVSRAVARLLDLGNIDRVVDDADRRRAHLRLSARGEAIYAEVAPATLEWETRLLEGFSKEERRAVDTLVAKLQAAAEALDDELSADGALAAE